MNILYVDSRQKIYHKEFGDISTDVPTERTFTYQNITEPIGEVTCVAISGCKVCSSQTTQEYDYENSYENAPHNANGMYPPDWFGSIVKRGLRRLNSVNVYETIWRSYWRVDTDGPGDRFDNTITAMNHANSACMVWSTWYPNWTSMFPMEVMPQGEGRPLNHCWVITGWQVVNGVTMLIVDGHIGKPLFMPREIFNAEISKMGFGTGIPTTVAIEAIKRRSLIQYIIDLCKNAILLLRQLPIDKQSISQQQVNDNQTVIPNQIKVYSLDSLCIAIRDFEGKPGDLNYINNNPGNCVYYDGGYDPKYGHVTEVGRFAHFETYELGMLYLHNMILHTIQAHPEWTLFQYFALKHAPASDNNDPLHYAQIVAKQVGCTTDTKLSAFLT